jgi:uncharacterized membrane protein
MRRLLLIAFGAVTFYHLIALAWGWPNPFWLMPLNTLLQWGFALAHALPTLGRRRALLLLGLTFGISLTLEAVGVATGWIYGPYAYTDRLGPAPPERPRVDPPRLVHDGLPGVPAGLHRPG